MLYCFCLCLFPTLNLYYCIAIDVHVITANDNYDVHVLVEIFFLFSQPPSSPPTPLQISQTPLQPYSYQANLDIWGFYLSNFISKFPPYDTELISDSDLTPMDLHYRFFEKDRSFADLKTFFMSDGEMGDIGTILLEYTGKINMWSFD